MTEYKLVPVEPTHRTIFAAASEPTPLPDDVAAFVERLRTGGESYEELLDLCTRQAADMLERLARELADTRTLLAISFENAEHRMALQAQVKRLDEELAAVKAENEKLRKDAERYRFLRQLDARGIQVYYGANDTSIFGEELDAAIDAVKEGK